MDLNILKLKRRNFICILLFHLSKHLFYFPNISLNASAENAPPFFLLILLVCFFAHNCLGYFIQCPNENCLFRQYLRQTQILILEILPVFLWLKFSSSLILTKNPSFRWGTI